MIKNSIKEIRSSIMKLKQNLNFSSKDIIAYLFANNKNINNDYDYYKDNYNYNDNENEKEIQNKNNKSILSLKTPKIIDCINDSTLPICQ
jgi:hypothetical protein